MQRRGFLAGILAAGFAPAAIGSGILMPVKKIQMPLGEYLASGMITPNKIEVGSISWDDYPYSPTVLTIRDYAGNIILQSGPDLSVQDILSKRMHQEPNSHRAFCLIK